MSYLKEEHLKLTSEFYEVYSLGDLKDSFEYETRKFFVTQEKFLEKQGVPPEYFQISINKDKITKKSLSELVGIAFLTKPVFHAFRESLPKEVQQILDALVWEKSLTQDEILENLGIKIWNTEERRYSARHIVNYNKLKKEYSFFKQINQHIDSSSFGEKEAFYSLYLPPFLRKHIAQFYRKPRIANIIPLENLPPTEYVYDKGERDVFLEFQRLVVYHQQGQIKATKRDKVQSSTLAKMQRKLNLNEFYPKKGVDKSLQSLRTALMASLILKSYVRNKTGEEEQAKLVKKLFVNNYLAAYDSLLGIITHLKGVNSVPEYCVNDDVETALLALLYALPEGKWVSLENISFYLKYNLVETKLIKDFDTSTSLYYEIKDTYDNGQSYSDRKYVDAVLLDKAITIPLLKGSLFLYAAFGLLDIAFDQPNLKVLGKTAYSPYDGLRFVRLTPLGAYVVDQKESYQPEKFVKDTKIKLSEDSLTIISDKHDPTAAVVLEPFMQKVTANRFRTDATIFLKDCKSKIDLKIKISSFRRAIAQELPANWQSFFNELETKVDPIEMVRDVVVYKISADNADLIQLIARDEGFRDIVMKAEGYQILVQSENLARFKARLREFGYLLS